MEFVIAVIQIFFSYCFLNFRAGGLSSNQISAEINHSLVVLSLIDNVKVN